MSSCGKNENPQEMNRRKFLKVFGGGAVASSAALYGCAPKNEPGAAVALGEVPTDKMTYRQHPTNGDKVSILGYGCMRWPLKQGSDGKDQIDQEAVNRLVDYAIEHGVNYFDTSPVYVQGMSEKATGIALARHPRNSYYLATKLSNFQNYTRENSLAMYRQSFRDLQTDYLDLLLLHRPSPLMNPREIAETFDELREQKKVRHFGVSNFTPSQFELINDAFPLVTNQVEISINHTDAFYNGTLDQMLLKKLRPMAWSVMGNYFTQPCAQNARIKKVLDELCTKYGAEENHILLAFLFLHPAQILPVIGTSKGQTIKDLKKSLDLKLDREDWFRLLQASEGKEVD